MRDATSAPITMADRLAAAITRNNRALDAAHGRMLDGVGMLYVLKSAFIAPIQAAKEFDRVLAEIGAKGSRKLLQPSSASPRRLWSGLLPTRR